MRILIGGAWGNQACVNMKIEFAIETKLKEISEFEEAIDGT